MREENFDIRTKECATSKVVSEKRPEIQKFSALCTNCDERYSCKIRNNTSAIWHCEEYK